MIEAKLNASDVARVFRVLKRTEPELVKQLARDLKNRVGPVGKKVASSWDGIDYPSGIRNARPEWKFHPEGVSSSVSFTPGAGKKNAKKLVTIYIKHKGAVPYVFDFIGWRSQGRNFSGKSLFNWVNNRFPGWPHGGRIFYRAFMGQRWNIYQAAEKIINDWSKQFEKEI